MKPRSAFKCLARVFLLFVIFLLTSSCSDSDEKNQRFSNCMDVIFEDKVAALTHPNCRSQSPQICSDMTRYPLSLRLQNYKATAKAYLCDIRGLFGFECSSVWNYDDCVAFNTDFCKWFSMPEPCYYYGCLEDSRDRCAKEYKEFAQSEKTPVTGSQQGTLTWKDHGNYVGDIKNGLPHGHGTFTWNSGSKYVGEFKDGKKHGQGTYTFADGGTFIGEYKNRKPWDGVHYDKDGNKSAIYADGVRQ